MIQRLTPLLLAACACVAQAKECPVDDVYADFLHLATATKEQSEEARREALHHFIGQHAALYAPSAIGAAPSDSLDRTGLAEMTAVQASALEFDRALQGAVSTTVRQFAQVLPDFQCDFPIHVAPTFGRMDGAGRVVDGHPALVLGPDVIASYQSAAQLPVFLTHELFHRYHFAMAGFSDDLAEQDQLWRTLWAEGLATYASAQLNPERPLSDAWLLPRDLAERAAPLVPALVAELSPRLDAVDAGMFGRFFEYGDASAQARGWPSRSGYYLGYLVAQRLAQRYSLQELAHLKGAELRSRIGEVLAAMADNK
jgi:hypothetical protein